MNHTVFKHSGNAGDIIYAMAGIKQACANDGSQALLYLWLDRPGFYYPGAEHPLKGVMLNNYMFDMLKPLLEAQDYVEAVKPWGYEKIHVDLDKFRVIGEHIGLPYGNIARWYFYKYPDMATDLSKPWLFIEAEDKSLNDKILVNRTSRYQNPYINYSLLNDYDGVVFTGVWEEYQAFKKQVPNASYLRVNDFYELATAIKSCKFFIGNQSMCFAIAEAMKVPRILEVCSFAPNVIPEGANGYDFYLEEAFKFYVNKLYKEPVRDSSEYMPYEYGQGIVPSIRNNKPIFTEAPSPFGQYIHDFTWEQFKQIHPIESGIKIFHTSCDRHNRIDGAINDNWVKLTNQVDTMIDADIVCLDLSWFKEFEFDPSVIAKIKHLNKKVVVVDYIEYGKEMSWTHVVGRENFSEWNHGEYERLDTAMREIQSNVILYFKREITKSEPDYNYPIIPIDYYAQHDNEPDTPWDVEHRDIDILMIWGYSNPIRPLVAGELIKQCFSKGRQLATTVEQCDQIEGQKVAVLFKPDFDRMHPLKMFELQGRAKITVSLPGSGVKCFRDSEAPFNSIMAKMEDNVQRAYEWKNGFNCISFRSTDPEVIATLLFNAIDDLGEDISQIYANGQETMRRYVRHRYVKEHILGNIEKVLKK